MKKRLVLIPALLLLAVVPARSQDVMLYAVGADAVHVNVFRPLGGVASSAPEVSMFFGKLEVYADPNQWWYPEEGGCVDIFHNGVIDYGCGEFVVQADGVMGVTTVSGVLDTTAYAYDPDTGFEEIGPSQITVDLTVTGDGPVEVSPYTNYAVGVCGLPPDTRGVFADGRPELQRSAAMTGTLESQHAGSVDVQTLPTLLVKAFNVAVGACV